MSEKEKILEELLKLVNKNKFGDEEWAKRGLNPSDESVIKYMNDRLDIIIAELTLAVTNDATKSQLKGVLKKGLARYKRIDLDTEEAEFIVDYLDLLAHIVNIKFGNNLMRWLYGNFLFVLLKVGRIIRPERVIAIKRQPCTKCRAEIRIELKRKGSGRKSDWILGKCMTCQEYNMMESFADAKITGYHNFFPEEHLGKDEYSEEQANIRLEQVKYFRK
jgi:Domain of unknown function (DUF4844)